MAATLTPESQCQLVLEKRSGSWCEKKTTHMPTLITGVHKTGQWRLVLDFMNPQTSKIGCRNQYRTGWKYFGLLAREGVGEGGNTASTY